MRSAWARGVGCAMRGLCLAAVSVGGSGAGAQELSPEPPKQRGGFLVPTIGVAQTQDSNLFFTQFPESDFVTRIGAGVDLGYRSTPFTVDLQGSRSGEVFARHPEFNTTQARTLGQLSLTWVPYRPLTISVFACYLDTKTPSELNLVSGLAVGRSLATRVTGTPALEYRLGSVSTLNGAFPVAHDTLDGRVSDTRSGIVGFDRRVSRRDTLSLRYERRWFDFSGGDKTEQSTADVVTVGWMGDIGERTLVLLRGGPRYGKGDWSAELLGAMKHRVKGGLVSLTYSKTQATTLGTTGALDTQSLVVAFTRRVARKLEIASGPGAYRNVLRGEPLVALRLNVEALWHFTPWMHLGTSYSFDLQQPDFGAPGHIRRGALQVRLLTSPPQRPLESPASDAEVD